MQLTVASLVRDIARLDRKRVYPYVIEANPGRIRIMEVSLPNGPVKFKRFNPSKGRRQHQAKLETISETALATVADALARGDPICLDSVFQGSGNNRSVIESILAHTPSIYVTWPYKSDVADDGKPKRGVKHIVWRKDGIHAAGMIKECETDYTIPAAAKDSLSTRTTFPEISPEKGIILKGELDLKRHKQMQHALIRVGHALGNKTWIAINDKDIYTHDPELHASPGVIKSLDEVPILMPKAIKAGNYLDCAWFTQDFRDIPAVFEVENSTKVTSGLSRMTEFRDSAPLLDVRWVIVAARGERDRVIQEANKEQFRSLRAKFLSYEALDELSSILTRYGLRGTTAAFLDNWIEECVLPE